MMATASRYANGHARRKVRAWLKAQGRPCALCGRPIDYDLPAGDPMSFEVDEIVPVSRGGSPIDQANVQPAHRICNERRGNRPIRRGAGTADADAAMADMYGPRSVDVGCRTSRSW